MDQKLYDKNTARNIKPTTNWKVLIISNYEGVYKQLQAMKNSYTYKEKSVLISSSWGYWGLSSELGGLAIVEEGLEGESEES